MAGPRGASQRFRGYRPDPRSTGETPNLKFVVQQPCIAQNVQMPSYFFSARTPTGPGMMMMNCTIKPAHAVPLANARQHPENPKENQAGHSPERTVEGHGGRPALGSQPEG